MSDITYLAIQAVILICYASYIAYRAGKAHGHRDLETTLLNDRKVAEFYLNLKKGERNE
jgi:hypothetical protein